MTAGIKANSDGSAAIQVGGTDVITLTSGGAATFLTSPTTVQAGTAAAPSITFSGDTNTGIYSPGADQVAIATGGTAAIYANSSQNVGIGTNSPNSRLSIAVSSTSTSVLGGYANVPLLLQNTSNTDNNWSVIAVQDASGDFSSYIGTQNTSQSSNTAIMAFATNGGSGATERMRIDSSGNLLVNRTNLFNSEKFGVTFSSNTGAGVVINDSNGQNGNTFIQFRNNGTTAGSITSNGTTTMTYGSASDYRLKENLVPLTGALAKIAALQPKVGNWKADGSDFIGFVAHELQEVFPDAVVGEKDKTDADGNPEYQMVDTGSAGIIATLTAAIQELKAELDATKAEVAALKGI